jgi:hypothetical protein
MDIDNLRVLRPLLTERCSHSFVMSRGTTSARHSYSVDNHRVLSRLPSRRQQFAIGERIEDSGSRA